MNTHREWVDWLASTGYGLDFNHDVDPPCTRRELAEAYHRQEAADSTEAESVRIWEWCIAENTGALSVLPPAVGREARP